MTVAEIITRLEQLVRDAYQLGLYSTTGELISALNVARTEQIIGGGPSPSPGISVSFIVGPVQEQPNLSH